jgi:putative FmdB family regulatory protein
VPTYQYACTECGEGLEVVQSFSDPALSVCPACGGRLRKVFTSVGVVFKGSGFYRTDSRESGKKKAAASDGGSGGAETAASAKTSPESAASTSGSSESAPSKPAAAAAGSS